MSTLKPVVSAQDHVQGAPSANIEIVEYGDYQCPHCGNAYPIIKNIQKTFGNQIRFVYRNFPLAESHEQAYPAAQAAEAGALQHKFWELHDALFENQDQLGEALFENIASKLQLNIATFNKDYSSPKVKDKIDNDFESGIRSGVNGTPSFYVNGKKFDGGAADLLQMLKDNAS